MIAVARDRHVIGNGEYVAGVDPACVRFPPFVEEVLRSSAEPDRLCVLRTLHLPGVAVTHPVIGILDLITVVDMLVEHAIFVAQTVSGYR